MSNLFYSTLRDGLWRVLKRGSKNMGSNMAELKSLQVEGNFSVLNDALQVNFNVSITPQFESRSDEKTSEGLEL